MLEEHSGDAQGTTLTWLAEEGQFRVDAVVVALDRALWIPQSLYTDKKNVYGIDEKTREKAADSGRKCSLSLARVLAIGDYDHHRAFARRQRTSRTQPRRLPGSLAHGVAPGRDQHHRGW